MTTTTNHPSGLPEQEPTSPTAVVLCGGEAWAKTGADWEARTQWLGAWGDLRVFAAERGGATLFDLADLPTGLTEVQKEVVSAKWRSGDPDEKLTELLRVARMEGAHAVAVVDGVTHSGSVEVRRDAVDYPYLALGDAGASYNVWFYYTGWTISARTIAGLMGGEQA